MNSRHLSRVSPPALTRLAGAVLLLGVALVPTLVTLHAASGIDAIGGRPGLPVLGPDAEDGVLPDGTTVADGSLPGIANLDGSLLDALRLATAAASEDGIELRVDSGWRSPAYQSTLLREAVATYGSEKAARRWVATPGTSSHVAGRAVDVGPSAAATWLARHGARFGLCRTYRNEPWHFELVTDAVGHRCPQPYPDPAHDPRMQR